MNKLRILILISFIEHGWPSGGILIQKVHFTKHEKLATKVAKSVYSFL
jgi:hypothetical protein